MRQNFWKKSSLHLSYTLPLSLFFRMAKDLMQRKKKLWRVGKTNGMETMAASSAYNRIWVILSSTVSSGEQLSVASRIERSKLTGVCLASVVGCGAFYCSKCWKNHLWFFEIILFTIPSACSRGEICLFQKRKIPKKRNFLGKNLKKIVARISCNKLRISLKKKKLQPIKSWQSAENKPKGVCSHNRRPTTNKVSRTSNTRLEYTISITAQGY